MTSVDIASETPTDRAVRCALAAGTANLRLQRVREVLDQCTPEDRRRILAALEDEADE